MHVELMKKRICLHVELIEKWIRLLSMVVGIFILFQENDFKLKSNALVAIKNKLDLLNYFDPTSAIVKQNLQIQPQLIFVAGAS